MLKIELPEKPVDRYQIVGYTLVLGESYCYPRKIVWEYHMDTKWSDYAPDKPGGADIVDQWMIIVDGTSQGRTNDGWEAIKQISMNDYFSTWTEAYQWGIKKLDRWLNHYAKKIANIEEMRDEMQRELNLLSTSNIRKK